VLPFELVHCLLDRQQRNSHMPPMNFLNSFDTPGQIWAGISALSAISVLISSLADRRRHRRTDINAVGFMPWTLITVFGVLATVLSAAIAIKAS
jgi:hypothetical protein